MLIKVKYKANGHLSLCTLSNTSLTSGNTLKVVDEYYLELLEEGRRQVFFRELAFQEGDPPEQTNHSILVDRDIVINHLRELPFYNQPIELDFIVRRYYNIAKGLGVLSRDSPNLLQIFS